MVGAEGHRMMLVLGRCERAVRDSRFLVARVSESSKLRYIFQLAIKVIFFFTAKNPFEQTINNG